jgi:hypothetical protein
LRRGETEGNARGKLIATPMVTQEGQLMRNERYKDVNLNRIHRGKLKVRRFTSLYRVRQAMRKDQSAMEKTDGLSTKKPPAD